MKHSERGRAAAVERTPRRAPRAGRRAWSRATTLDGTATVLSATALACELPIVCNTRCGASVSVSLAGGEEDEFGGRAVWMPDDVKAGDAIVFLNTIHTGIASRQDPG